jgi:S1-C subfamily serine protease
MRGKFLTFILGCALLAGPADGRPFGTDGETRATRVWLGVFLGDALDGGVEVVAVIPGGPAFKCGIRERDLLLSLDGKPIASREDLGRLLLGIDPGTEVVAELLREGRAFRKTVRLEPRPAPVLSGVAKVITTDPGVGLQFARELKVAAMPPELRQHFGAPADHGVLVTSVTGEGGVYQAGLRVGDVLLAVGSERVVEPSDVRGGLVGMRPGGTVDLEILREGKRAVLRLRMPEAGDGLLLRADPLVEFSGGGAAEAVRIRLLEERIKQLEQELRVLREELDRLQQGR